MNYFFTYTIYNIQSWKDNFCSLAGSGILMFNKNVDSRFLNKVHTAHGCLARLYCYFIKSVIPVLHTSVLCGLVAS